MKETTMKRQLELVLAVFALLPFAAQASVCRIDPPGAGEKLPATAYIQNGLLLHYDGFANAGTEPSGAAYHDSQAVKWTNLGTGGSEYDLTKHLGTASAATDSTDPQYGFWKEDGYSFTNTMFAYKNAFAIPTNYTMQVVLDAKGGDQKDAGGNSTNSFVFAYQGQNTSPNRPTELVGSMVICAAPWVGSWQEAQRNSLFVNEEYRWDNVAAASGGAVNGTPFPSLAPEREWGIGSYNGSTAVTTRQGGGEASTPFTNVTVIVDNYNEVYLFAGETRQDLSSPAINNTSHFSNGYTKGNKDPVALTAPDGFRLGNGVVRHNRNGIKDVGALKGTIKNFRYYYDRILTDDELRWNRKVDNIRFHGSVVDMTNIVSRVEPMPGDDQYSPEEYYIVSPEGGALSAPVTNVAVGGVLHGIRGYAVETWDGSAWSAAVTNRSLSYPATYGADSKVRITWLWGEHGGIHRIYKTASGAATISPSAYVQDGLLLPSDGIANAGTDLSGAGLHDSQAVKWTNLGTGGSEYDLEKHLNTQAAATGSVDPWYGEWLEDGYRFGSSSTNTSMFAYTKPFAIPATYTMQVVLDAAGGDQRDVDGNPSKSFVFAYQGADVADTTVPTERAGSMVVCSSSWMTDAWRFAHTNSLCILARNVVPKSGGDTPALAPEREWGVGYYNGSQYDNGRKGADFASTPFTNVTAIIESCTNVFVFAGTTPQNLDDPKILHTSHFANGYVCGTNAVTELTASKGFSLGNGTTRNVSDVRLQGTESLKGTIKSFRYYKDRALTDDELRWNRFVDNARFHGGATPTNIVSRVEPLPGESRYSAEEYFIVSPGGGTFCAPVTNATAGGTSYGIRGYAVETWNGHSWSAAETNWAPSCNVAYGLDSKVRITWLWGVSGGVHRIYETESGAATISPSAYVQDGLILHYDGIANAGVDFDGTALHDSSAVKWANLGSLGARYDLGLFYDVHTRTNDYSYTGASWSDFGFGFNHSISFGTTNAFAVPVTYTIQTLVDAKPGDQYFDSGHGQKSMGYVFNLQGGSGSVPYDPTNTGNMWRYGSIIIRNSGVGNNEAGTPTLTASANILQFNAETAVPGDVTDKNLTASYRPSLAPEREVGVFENPNDRTGADFADRRFSYVTAMMDSFTNAVVFAGLDAPWSANVHFANGHEAYADGKRTPVELMSSGFRLGDGGGFESLKGTIKSLRYYAGRNLSREELEWNRYVDKVRFGVSGFGDEGIAVDIQTNVVANVAPAPGETGFSADQSYLVSPGGGELQAPATNVVVDGAIYGIRGYVAQSWNGSSWSVAETNWSTKCPVGYGGNVRITWLWAKAVGVHRVLPGESEAMYSSAYVQDGLILHYDGYANAGTNATGAASHDSSAVTWTNLGSEGATYDLGKLYDVHTPTSETGEGYGAWEADGFYFPHRISFGTTKAFAVPVTYTIQTLVDAKPGDQYFDSGHGQKSMGYVFNLQGGSGSVPYDPTNTGNMWRYGSIIIRNSGVGNDEEGTPTLTASANILQFVAETAVPGDVTDKDRTASYRPSLAPEREVGVFENPNDRTGAAYAYQPFSYVTAMMDNFTNAVVFAGLDAPWSATAHFANGHEAYAGGARTPAVLTSSGFRLGDGGGYESLKGKVKNFRYYAGRIVPQDELEWNRSVDQARFFGELVTNIVERVQTYPGRDEYGEESYYAVGPGGGKLVGPKKAKWVGSNLYRPKRYTVETWNGTGWGPATLHESKEYNAAYDPSAKVRITWLLDEWIPPGMFLRYN